MIMMLCWVEIEIEMEEVAYGSYLILEKQISKVGFLVAPKLDSG
jgi:hypothetical protein